MSDTPETDAAKEECGKLPGIPEMYGYMCAHAEELERENARLREATIEECAKVCDEFKKNDPETVAGIIFRSQLAAAIRALKKKGLL